jgi:hypothetical protein
MVRAQRMLESRVRRAGINEIRPSELADVSESLEDVGIYEIESELIDPDVIPDWVAQYLEAGGLSRGGRYPFGPAFFVTSSTLPNFSKFSRNIPASFFACAS